MTPCGPGDARLLQELLGRLDPGGILSCACGREHRIAAGDVLVAGDATFGAAELLRRRYGPRPTVWVLSDENTEAAAGARWKSACGGTKVRSRVLPAAPRPVPSLELADALAAEVMGSPPDLLVAVGGGVISDLVKRVSLRAGVPNWCIATAPSVDAFSSATAALRVDGLSPVRRGAGLRGHRLRSGGAPPGPARPRPRRPGRPAGQARRQPGLEPGLAADR